MRDLYVARRSGAVMLPDGNGVQRRHAIQRGVTVAEKGSAMLDKHGKLFEPMRVHYPAPARGVRREPPVETMTAAPGEQREVRPYRCDQCGATAKSPAGLAAHRRSHALAEPSAESDGQDEDE